MENRVATVTRKTRETDIAVSLKIDGSGEGQVSTGIGFFDHMLDQLCRHSLMDLNIAVKGDLHIDDHHTIEDTGIALGQAFAEAVGDKKGIIRFGWAAVPLDEALALVSLDLSGRGFLCCEMGAMAEKVGDFTAEMLPEFLRAFAASAGITLHVRILTGSNSHHKIEATFKALAQALRAAITRDERIGGIPSTKGVL